MANLISREALYEKTCEWEAQALHMCEVTMNDEDKTEWRRWSAILKERSAFKFDVADATAIDAVEVVRCKDCTYGEKAIGVAGDVIDCKRLKMVTRADWFCAEGRKKDETIIQD